MSAEQSAKLRGLAEAIFVGMAARYGSKHWDWQPVATTAVEAAEVFDRAFTDRYSPQSSTPSTEAPPPLPSDQSVPPEAPAVPVGTEPQPEAPVAATA